MDEGVTEFERDVCRATSVLHSLAVELLHVPVDSCTRELHIRALDYKRDVARWTEGSPSAETRAAVISDLEALQRDATWWREEQPSGQDMLAAARVWRPSERPNGSERR